MSQTKRSDSSAAFRAQLKRDYVQVPEVNSRIDIDRYVLFAKTPQEEANKAIKNGEFSRAYIDLSKFVLLLTKIATHASYAQRSDIKKWVKVNSEAAFQLLERVVCELDGQHDKRREEAIDQLLAVTFDYAEPTPPPPPRVLPTASPTAAHNKLLSAFFVPEYEGQQAPVLQPPSLAAVEAATPATAPSSSASASAPALPIVTVLQPTTPLSPQATVAAYRFDAILAAYRASTHSSPEDVALVRELFARTRSPSGPPFTFHQFPIPLPTSRALDLYLSPQRCFHVIMDDFYASFAPFMAAQHFALAPDVQVSRAAVETNRCLFLHLGVATQTHPYLLQAYFRQRAWSLLHVFQQETARQLGSAGGGGGGGGAGGAALWYEDLLQSVLQYSGLVDANVLPFLWPREWNRHRIFGSHFTLIRPRAVGDSGEVAATLIDRLLFDAEAAQLTIQRHTALTMAALSDLSGVSPSAFVTPYATEDGDMNGADDGSWWPSIAHTLSATVAASPVAL
eukprot:gene10106-7203_t